MKPELEQKLYDKYPQLFVRRNWPETKTAMCWGICVDDGWFDVIDALCAAIDEYATRNRKMHADMLRKERAVKRALKGDERALIYFVSKAFKLSPEKDVDRIEKIIELTIRNIENDKRFFKSFPPPLKKIAVEQVKEKFGGLRFYVDNADDRVYGLIDMAERISVKTCEVCGARGIRRNNNGWVKTLCDEHFKSK